MPYNFHFRLLSSVKYKIDIVPLDRVFGVNTCTGRPAHMSAELSTMYVCMRNFRDLISPGRYVSNVAMLL